MKHRAVTLLLQAAALLCLGAAVHAAPLDPFLEAGPHTKPGTGFVEFSSDGMSKQLDLLRLRPEGLTDDSAGVLRGFRLRAGYGVNSQLWIDGGFFRRQIFTAESGRFSTAGNWGGSGGCANH